MLLQHFLRVQPEDWENLWVIKSFAENHVCPSFISAVEAKGPDGVQLFALQAC